MIVLLQVRWGTDESGRLVIMDAIPFTPGMSGTTPRAANSLTAAAQSAAFGVPMAAPVMGAAPLSPVSTEGRAASPGSAGRPGSGASAGAVSLSVHHGATHAAEHMQANGQLVQGGQGTAPMVYPPGYSPTGMPPPSNFPQ